ncbi:MAG: hypothetical protein KDK36_11165 [Leptospiraceae bacterium]|nr:hypothetical protein [Leptospiraceae bacterium]
MLSKYIIIFSVLLFLKTGSIFSECISGDCTNGYGSAIFPKGDIYTGEWKNNQAEGKGQLVYKNGNIFFGEWKNGKANGIGEMIYDDKTRYVGEWLNSQAHGSGIVYDKDGNVLYSGKWKYGKKADKNKRVKKEKE